MLIGRPTPYGAGIEIFGDNMDLKCLHNTVHSLAGTEGTPGNVLLLNLAYEIRKAISNEREINMFAIEEEKITYRGFKIFWLHLFATAKFLRESAGFIITSPEIQSDVYRIEAIVENCLKSFDKDKGLQIFEWLRFNEIPRTDYIDLLILQLTFKNLQINNGKARFKHLVKDLDALMYNNPEHVVFRRFIEDESKRFKCAIKDIDMDIDFEKTGFRW